MTIGNAILFIKRGLFDGELRDRLNGASTPPEFQKILDGEKLVFTDYDFDEAYHHLLVKCQEEEDADQLKEFKMWWDLSAQILSPDTCGTGCSGGCCP